MRKKHHYLISTFIWLSLIAYTSSLSASTFPAFQSWAYSLVHFTEYFILTFLVYHTLFHHGVHRINAWIITLGGLLALAGIDEWHQRFIQGRIPSTEDFLFDALGISLMVILLILVHQITKSTHTKISLRIS